MSNNEESLNNGHVIEVTPDMFERAANDFSEGNESLKKLLLYCFENDIKTNACCSGHDGEKTPFVLFEFNDKNIQAILKILKQLSIGEVIDRFRFVNQPSVASNFWISMKNDKANEGFEQILNALQYEKEVDINEIDKNHKLMVKCLQNHSVENSYMEFQEDKDEISVAVDMKDYLIFDYTDETPEYWREDTDLMRYPKDSKKLENVLEKLENEIENKNFELEHSKKSQREKNEDSNDNVFREDSKEPEILEDKFEKSEDEIKHKQEILESNEKNRKYASEHTRNQEKIDEYMQDRYDRNKIRHNVVASMERQNEYKEMNVSVFDVLPGTSIEYVAKELMQLNEYGQPCVTEFNSIKIDTRDYNSPDELIQAYEQECEKARQEHEMQKSNKGITVEEIKDATKSVRISEINSETTEIRQEFDKEKQPKERDSQNINQEL